MTVVAMGYYGMNNFGDDLFRRVVTDNQSRIWPNRTVDFAAPAIGADGLWAQAYRRSDLLGGAVRALAATSAIRHPTRAYCGGSLFQDVRGVRRIHALAAERGQGRYEALGVSIGPFADDEAQNRVQRFLASFDRIVVRDQISLDEASRLGLSATMGGDLAGLVPRRSLHSKNEEDHIVVVPCSTPGAWSEKYISGIRCFIDALAPERVTVLSLNSHPRIGDDDVCHRVAHSLRDSVRTVSVNRYADVGMRETMTLLQGSRVTVATRLHAAIVSYMGGNKTVMVAYHRKSQDFAHDIGFPPELMLDPDSHTSGWLTAATAIERTCSISPDQYAERAQAAYFH